MSVLSLENVSKKIGSRSIVEALDMTIQPAEVYGFLGPNGAGKTTTIRMIVGLARPTSGRVRILGHDVQRDRSAALAYVGAIVENPETYKYLTGRENLIHYARLAGLTGSLRRRRIDEVTRLVDLKERIDDKVKRYSLGMRQRLGVAQALLANPKLLVLDEPTNGLDPAGMREFRELMRNLANDGMAVFVSSHLLGEIQMMCDRVSILKDGRILTESRVSDLLDAARAGIRISVGQAPLAAAVLASQQIAATATGESLLTVAVPRTRVPEVVRALVAAGVDVYGIEEVRDSLEDMFLHLTAEAAAQRVDQAGEEETVHG